ncbi:MAG: hypothetical protein ACTHU0_25230 [Kofleriaceae bacterium]
MRWQIASALLAAVLGAASPALARSEKTLAYSREQAWSPSVRFLAVDERLKLVEKDADAGYVLFELRDDGKLFRGSLEVTTVVVDGRSQVRFILKIEDRPSWLEIAMLQRLERKLRAELGSPAPPPSSKARERGSPERGPSPPPADDGKPRDRGPSLDDPPPPSATP